MVFFEGEGGVAAAPRDCFRELRLSPYNHMVKWSTQLLNRCNWRKNSCFWRSNVHFFHYCNYNLHITLHHTVDILILGWIVVNTERYCIGLDCIGIVPILSRIALVLVLLRKSVNRPGLVLGSRICPRRQRVSHDEAGALSNILLSVLRE